MKTSDLLDLVALPAADHRVRRQRVLPEVAEARAEVALTPHLPGEHLAGAPACSFGERDVAGRQCRQAVQRLS
eukprot:SAG22_NODE_48_length_24654_cov_4.406394_16_plen_73_part_00